MAKSTWFTGGTLKRVGKNKKGLFANHTTAIDESDSEADHIYLLGAGLKYTDPEEERDPPAQPTPVTFPAYERRPPTNWDSTTNLPDLQSLFAKVLKATDITHEHVEALNIETCDSISLDDLLPLAPDRTSYLPPLTPDQAITSASYADATKADPAVSRKRKDFDDRLTELRVDNDTAYRVLSRTLRNGARGPRLAHMRKFWEGLECMSRYWDSSLDHYYELAVSSPDSDEQSPKRQRLDDRSEGRGAQTKPPFATTISAADCNNAAKILPTPRPSPGRHDSGSAAPTIDSRSLRSQTASPEPHSQQRYKGRRTHTGHEMPDQFRADTVRAFVEATAWPSQCTLAAPRVMPVVQLDRLNLPVRQTAAVYRVPLERAKARSGRLEGPLLAVQVRGETDLVDEAKCRLDYLREIGGLLQLAEERRREGKMAVKPGEGKWWTTTPRWGGGPGGEVQTKDDADSDVAQSEGDEGRKKTTPSSLWKGVRCGRGLWDMRTDYAAIGKDPASQYDEIFMVSSLNHHISIVKLTIHQAYTDCLVSGKMPELALQNPAWCRSKLQRSKWFDLFDADERVEAFRGLWGTMAYLTRVTDTGATAKADDAEMSDTQ